MTLAADFQIAESQIREHGWTKAYWRNDPGDPRSPIQYTVSIGLPEAFGLPELVMFGQKEVTIEGVFANVVNFLRTSHPWTGAPLRLTGVLNEVPVELRRVVPEHYSIADINAAFRTATGRAPFSDLAQIIWPSPEGQFPWDPGAAGLFDHQRRLDISWKS
jgi:hypothetical protein